MPLQRLAGAACVAGAVWLLAGPGWALLTVGLLLLVAAPAVRAGDVVQRARTAGKAAWGVARALPRRSTAVSAMTLGVVGVPTGMGLAFGIGAAVVAAGGLLVGVAILTGWNA